MASRFVIAGPILWIIATRPWRRERTPGSGLPPRRAFFGGIGLGFVGYATQASLFQGAVNRTGAALADLLLYAYPALVVVMAWAIGRESPDRRRLVALVVASVGVVLVLVGGGGSEFDGVGVAMGLGAALAYTLYVLGCDAVVRGVTPFQLAALVSTGAAAAFLIAGALGIGGGLDLGFSGKAWLAVIGIAIVGTVIAVSAFLASLELIGPSRSSILSTLEPVVTVILAYVILGERLGPVQLLGGALVLAACILLQLRRTSRPAAAAEPS